MKTKQKELITKAAREKRVLLEEVRGILTVHGRRDKLPPESRERFDILKLRISELNAVLCVKKREIHRKLPPAKLPVPEADERIGLTI